MKKGILFRIEQIIVGAVLLGMIIVPIAVYVHFDMQRRQAERELIYRKARALAAEEQHQQLLRYQKRFEQQRRRQQYNSGGVVGVQTRN